MSGSTILYVCNCKTGDRIAGTNISKGEFKWLDKDFAASAKLEGFLVDAPFFEGHELPGGRIKFSKDRKFEQWELLAIVNTLHRILGSSAQLKQVSGTTIEARP